MSAAVFGDERLPERFWAKVAQADSGCWEWTAGRDPKGYGRFKAEVGTLAHRVTYLTLVGSHAEGLELDHLCRNRACCNPAHLEPVTRRENVLRSPIANAAVNARKTHCIRNHELSGANVRSNSKGGRECVTCYQEYMRTYRREWWRRKHGKTAA